MFGYTGTYKGKEISVMGGGMGMPSIGIYSYELFNFYDVDQIIRIGSAGALQDHMKLMDVVIGMGACTDSNYAYQYGLPGTFAPIADYELLNRAVETAKRQGTNVVVGNVLPPMYSTTPWAMSTICGVAWAFWLWRWRRRRFT